MSLFAAVSMSLWLGILTSISPCPLATNIAAVFYIGRRMDKPRLVLTAGLLYSLGRMLTYAVLTVILTAAALSVSGMSFFLQAYMNKLLGPILILAGMFLLELIQVSAGGRGMSEKLQGRVDRMGVWGAGLLGIVFALSFCPVSAAMYFGGLLPLAVGGRSVTLLPLVYGFGTALPVLAVAVIAAFSAHAIGAAFDKLRVFELWSRRVTGAAFILIGVYFCLVFIFNIKVF